MGNQRGNRVFILNRRYNLKNYNTGKTKLGRKKGLKKIMPNRLGRGVAETKREQGKRGHRPTRSSKGNAKSVLSRVAWLVLKSRNSPDAEEGGGISTPGGRDGKRQKESPHQRTVAKW